MKGRQNMTDLKTSESATKRAALLPSEETSSHIPIRPLYTPADLAARDYDRDVGYPGEFPYTRGVQATMYRGRLWTVRQYAGMGDAEESNKRYKYLLAHVRLLGVAHAGVLAHCPEATPRSRTNATSICWRMGRRG